MPSLDSLPAVRDPRDSRDLKSGTIISDRNGYYDSQNIVAVEVADQQHPTSHLGCHYLPRLRGGPRDAIAAGFQLEAFGSVLVASI